MKRLAATFQWDVRLQFRHGFYYAAIFVAIVFALILRALPAASLPLIMPIAVMGNMSINTYYFLAGLVLLEKDDGILEGLVVTPLRRHEYLWSKLLSLIALTLVENLFIVVVSGVKNVNWLWLVVGIVLLGFFNALYAFILVIRYDSLNSFLFPSAFYTMLLGVPILPYFNLWQSPLVYLHPVQPSLLLLKAGFHSIEGWQLGYAVAYGTGVVAVLFVWASRAFHQFVVIKRGGRR